MFTATTVLKELIYITSAQAVSVMDPLERRDLIENEENEINVNEDTIEGEKCNKCDKWFRTGWKSREHLHGKHLLRTI